MTRPITLFFRLLCLCEFLLVTFSEVHGQQSLIGVGQATPWYFANPQDLQSRIDELSRLTIPQSETALTHELDHIDNEMVSATSELAKYNGYKDWDKQVEDQFRRIRAAQSELSKVDCSQLGAFRQAYASFSTPAYALPIMLQNFRDIDYSLLTLPVFSTDETVNCKSIRDEVSKPEFSTGLDTLFANIKKSVEDAKNKATQTVDQYGKLIQALRDRRAKLQDALNGKTTKQQITANLPLIMSILGGACVLAIVAVRLFDAEIQMEWVASGQVIQFVTVMVLLSVITALALSSVLQENTLGTLLGGIAGYVLAQGVGRAAARDVTRGVRVGQTAQAARVRPPDHRAPKSDQAGQPDQNVHVIPQTG